MEYLLTGQEMKFYDEYTIQTIGVPSMVLMERAAMGCVEELLDGSFHLKKILVLCGSGNNGGDGFAIARLLFLKGLEVFVYFAGNEASCTEETRLQKKICEKYGLIFVSKLEDAEYTIMVDALFGVGLSRKIEGSYAQVVEYINHSKAKVLSVDIPSGISADSGKVMGISVRADKTVTFACRKLGHILYPGTVFSGKVVIKDIGITCLAGKMSPPKVFSLTKRDLGLLPNRPRYSNKGTFGRVLIIAGSPGMCGAACFAAKAAYRTGAGLVQIVTDECNRSVLQTMIPEAIITCFDQKKGVTEDLQKAMAASSAVLIGPGLGSTPDKKKMLEMVLGENSKPLIIDADGLNLLASCKELLKGQKREIILTPHLGEMSRLCLKSVNEIQESLLETASAFAAEYGVICVLKDARTIVTDGKLHMVNQSGNEGMATGGSGDVLAGILGAMAAQKLNGVMGASLGVYVHGLAGDAAKKSCSSECVMASDIVEGLKTVYREYTDGGKDE